MKSATLRPRKTAEELPRISPRFASPRAGNPKIADVCGKPLLKPPGKGGFCRAAHIRAGANFHYNTAQQFVNRQNEQNNQPKKSHNCTTSPIDFVCGLWYTNGVKGR